MMKPTTAPRAESNPHIPSLALEAQRRAPRRFARARLAAIVPAMAVAIAACQAEPEPESMLPADELASDEQGLTATDDGSDMEACGDPTGECDDDTDEPRGVFAIVRPLVSRVVQTGARTLRGLVDVADALPAAGLAGVRTCRDEVVTCLDAAVTDLDVGTCADSLEGCVDGVVDIIDPVLDPLPGPNGSGIVAATDICRADARDCLAGALSLSDVSSCSDVLGACIDGIEVIVDDTVDDVNDIIDPLAVPKPDEVIDCTLELAKCLADLQNPFDCAEQARICASL
jgi:hypothetical protein